MSDRVLRLPEVKVQTGKSRSAIYADIKSGRFPRPIHIGRRSVGWLQSELTAWLERATEKSANDEDNLTVVANTPGCGSRNASNLQVQQVLSHGGTNDV